MDKINNKDTHLTKIITRSRTYKVIDLFAGVGGIRLGFENAFKSDAEFVFSSEIDKFSKITYECNYGEIPHGDITQIEASEIGQHYIDCIYFRELLVVFCYYFSYSFFMINKNYLNLTLVNLSWIRY